MGNSHETLHGAKKTHFPACLLGKLEPLYASLKAFLSDLKLVTGGGGVNSKKVHFWRRRKFFQDFEDFARNLETSNEIFQQAQSSEVKLWGSLRLFLKCLLNIRDNILDF